MRQHSGVHEQVVSELMAVAGVNDYMQQDETARRKALLAAMQQGKNWRPSRAILRYRTGRTAHYAGCCDIHLSFGRSALPNYIISMTKGVSDMLKWR